MKRAFTVPLLFAAAVVVGAAFVAVRGQSDCAADCAEAATAEVATAELDIQGMRSLFCALDVQHALEGLAGVRAADVDRDAARATVTYDAALASPQAMIAAVEARGYGAALATTATVSQAPGVAGHAAAPSRLSPAEIERVSDFAAEHIMTTGDNPSGEAVEEATGIALSQADVPILYQAVLSRLAKDPRGQRLLEGSRCSDYGACSLWGNLNTATGDLLAMYEREKEADGASFEGLDLPAFEARTLAGAPARSADLIGRPAVLAFLAVHCNHSMDTFPILQELHRRLAPQGVQVVGVLVNSGSVEDANGWVPRFAPEYPIWVYEEASLGDLIESHLVPTYLLVDATGKVRQKLVGFKTQEAVVANLALIRAAATS